VSQYIVRGSIAVCDQQRGDGVDLRGGADDGFTGAGSEEDHLHTVRHADHPTAIGATNLPRAVRSRESTLNLDQQVDR
jgi:hypothetical protein